MGNTQEQVKLEYRNLMDTMTQINHQAFARTIWDDPSKAISLHSFWAMIEHEHKGKNPEIAKQAALEQRGIEAIMLKMRTLNAGFYNVDSSTYLDSRVEDITEEIEDTTTVDEILPETTVEETIVEGGKTVSLFNGKDMGDKPTHEDVSKAVKALLIEDKENDSLALAKQYFGTGNYTP